MPEPSVDLLFFMRTGRGIRYYLHFIIRRDNVISNQQGLRDQTQVSTIWDNKVTRRERDRSARRSQKRIFFLYANKSRLSRRLFPPDGSNICHRDYESGTRIPVQQELFPNLQTV